MSPRVIRAVIVALLRAVRPIQRRAMAHRLTRLEQGYSLARARLSEKELAEWASQLFSRRPAVADRCDSETLLRHRQRALDGLAGLPRRWRNPHAQAQTLRERIAGLLKAMSDLPCLCERNRPARTTAPPPDDLLCWPTSPAALAVQFVAWYHRRPPAAMRRRLIKAKVEFPVEQEGLRKFGEVADEVLRSKDIATGLRTIRRAQAQGVFSADQAAYLAKHLKAAYLEKHLK
jgi:hypothetical protein